MPRIAVLFILKHKLSTCDDLIAISMQVLVGCVAVSMAYSGLLHRKWLCDGFLSVVIGNR